MISAFVALVVLATMTVGIPAISFMQRQLDQQAWSQLEQGQRVTAALYEAQRRELESLATLTAQRPTLHQLLEQQDEAVLLDYLYTLQMSAAVDWIGICSNSQTVVTTVSDLEGCHFEDLDGYYIDESRQPGEIWMIARVPLVVVDTPGEVILGLRLNDRFTREMAAQTGLEHTLCLGDEPVATSFEGGKESLATFAGCGEELAVQTISSNPIDEHPYYVLPINLTRSGIRDTVALDVSEIAQTKSQTILWMVLAILGVASSGTLLGVVFSRRISKPLVQLSEAAGKFSQGDLDTPVEVQTLVREVVQVGRALEGARVDLLSTLTSLQYERNWRDRLLESIIEGILTLDDQNRITFFSRGAERITGWQRGHVMGRSCDDVFHLTEREKPFSSAIPPLGGRTKIDVLLADGREASLAVTGAELLLGESAAPEIALVFRDISEEEAVHRILGHFLANVAHEFRTPLSALAASIELLLDQAPALSQAELHELLNSLHLGTLGLQTLVDNLLESASIEAGHFRVSPRTVDLGNMIAEVVQVIQPLLEKYEQRLVVELPLNIPLVRADPRRTQQVVVNLLSNASRYGPPETEIHLTVTIIGKEARVSVADRGPGIPPADRINVFRRFSYPVAESSKSQAGAGLGLSVVKAIVDAQGGQVGVDGREGGGSVFWFTLLIVEN
jgi:PAS domain S-box-containing protein